MQGRWISIADAAHQPTVRFNKAMKSDAWYTLLLFDPDAVGGNKIHWLVMNIMKNKKKGNVIFPYLGPNPPPGSGIHRYIFLLIEQDHFISEITPPTKRQVPLSKLFRSMSLNNGRVVHSTFFRSSADKKYPTVRKKFQ